MFHKEGLITKEHSKAYAFNIQTSLILKTFSVQTALIVQLTAI